MSKVFRTVRVPLRDLVLVQHRCAWKGCRETTEIDNNLPRGWRWLALWHGPVGLPPWSAEMDRDAVLCPKHWRALDDLLEDIGQRLDKTEGNA